MPDIKKVIKGLELCLKTIDKPDCRKECPYYEACQKYEGRVIFQPLMRDTLALLKKHEAVKPIAKENDTYECICGAIVGWDKLDASGIVQTRLNYCPFCGQEVKWNET